jgi:hypothetical protein
MPNRRNWHEIWTFLGERDPLSAFAEDHGLCPWMNADTVDNWFLRLWVYATAEFAAGG